MSVYRRYVRYCREMGIWYLDKPRADACKLRRNPTCRAHKRRLREARGRG